MRNTHDIRVYVTNIIGTGVGIRSNVFTQVTAEFQFVATF